MASTEPDTLRNQMGSTASVIAEVVADLREKLPDLSHPTPIDDPESARFHLFDSIARFLKQAASTIPLVLMLEDLHWSDKPSLMLLEFVARELANAKIMIVGNYRDMELNRRHTLSVFLGDLSRERLFERVVLRGLQKHDVQRFIEIAAGISLPPALVQAVYSQTEGNPLFVTETVRLLIQEGDITAGRSSKGGTSSWEIRIPEGVREVIGRRLDRLSKRCNEVLTIAAVIGRQFRFDVLKMLSEGTTDGQLLDAMDEAPSARIIEELPDEVGFYQFTHAQMQETLIQEMSHTRAVRMHALIAEALEAHYGDEAKEHAAELVEHFAEAETVLGTEKLVDFCVAAGNRAWEQSAFEESHKFFLIAYGHIDSISVGEKWADVTFGRARVLWLEPKLTLQQVWDLMVASFEAYLVDGQPEKALDAIRYELSFAPTLTGVIEPLERALSIPAEGSIELAWIKIRYAIARHTQLADFDGAGKLLSEVLAAAQQSANRQLEGRALIHLCQLSYFHGDFEQAIELGEQSARFALETGDTVTLERAGFLTLSQIGIGKFEAAQKSLHRASEALAGRAVGEWARNNAGIGVVLSRAMGLVGTNTATLSARITDIHHSTGSNFSKKIRVIRSEKPFPLLRKQTE